MYLSTLCLVRWLRLCGASAAIFLAPLGAAVTVTVSDLAGQPLGDAVVSLTPLDSPPPPVTPSTGVVIAQMGEEYRPYITVVRVGTQIEFPNKDPIQHHIYSLSKPKPFEKPLYDSGASESVVFDKPGVVVLGCNIHDWMVAYVVVMATPYYVTTPTDGRAALADVPAGRYKVEVWHPRLPTPATREITVSAEAELAEAFRLKLRPDRRIRRAPVGEAKSY